MKKHNYIFCIMIGLFLAACEQPFIPDTVEKEPDIVVEGYIEAGEDPTPPYVILTKDVPFFSEFSADDLEEIFVHNAEVIVSDGEKEVQLTELCLDELTDQQKLVASTLFGISLDTIGYNFCVYIDLSFSMAGEIGKSYTLSINTDGKSIQATTTIPQHVPLEGLIFREPPGQTSDTLAQMICTVTDPGGVANFYRYQVNINDGGFFSPFSSVTNDRLFDGENTEFPLSKPEPRGTDDIDIATFGLYTVGDKVELKWISLDKAHYDFWNSLEFSGANQGPFSNPVQITSNIEGGLGIWGGMSVSYYEVEVEKE